MDTHRAGRLPQAAQRDQRGKDRRLRPADHGGLQGPVEIPRHQVTLKDDQVVTYKSINVGTAVAGDNGLVVPVIKNVQNKTLTDVARESKDLVARAREGRLAPEEYSEGTFSISNLGMFGIGNFTAIINAPESAILSVSSSAQDPRCGHRRERRGRHRHPAHDEHTAVCGSPGH